MSAEKGKGKEPFDPYGEARYTLQSESMVHSRSSAFVIADHGRSCDPCVGA